METAKKENVKYIQTQIIDILGILKGVTVPVSKLESVLEDGIMFDGSSIVGLASIEDSDLNMKPVPETFQVLPWLSEDLRTARLMCDIYKGNKRYDGDPRYVLERVLDRLKSKGMAMSVGPEYEFHLFEMDDNGNPTTDPIDHVRYYDLPPFDTGYAVRKQMVDYFDYMGFDPEVSHKEVGISQQELSVKYAEAMVTADRATLLKLCIKSTAYQFGLYATFMPKPIYGDAGNGMHLNQSIFMTKDGTNVFYDEKAKDKWLLSEDALRYITGLVTHVKEFSCVTSSWVNSYKRLVPGFEAPVYVAWANSNRSTLIRVPAGRKKATRVELRCPDPAGNPYLQYAVVAAAGLMGIEKKYDVVPPVEKNLYKLTPEERKKLGVENLPTTLGEALEYGKASKFLKETLGEMVYNN
ncbi:MAG: type I glutamate--ammonia ligase, partial [Candidatus Dadabacteria bacterium]|nr:type I glutamate--ammonia ligase [Candidatus Dadabacteria bacterium]